MNEIAEANKFVIIYPQTSYLNLSKNETTKGCWDFFGYTKHSQNLFEQTYISKEGEQMKFLYDTYIDLVQGNINFESLTKLVSE